MTYMYTHYYCKTNQNTIALVICRLVIKDHNLNIATNELIAVSLCDTESK